MTRFTGLPPDDFAQASRSRKQTDVGAAAGVRFSVSPHDVRDDLDPSAASHPLPTSIDPATTTKRSRHVPAADRLLTPLGGLVLAAVLTLLAFWLPLYLFLR